MSARFAPSAFAAAFSERRSATGTTATPAVVSSVLKTWSGSRPEALGRLDAR